MKKIMMILVCLGMVLVLSSCKKEEEKPDVNKQDVIVNNDITKLEDLTDSDFDITKWSLVDIPYVFLERLSRLTNYKKETKGATIAKAIIKYTQTIDDVFINTESEKHLITKSSSLLVKVYHEAYFNDVVSYRDSEKDEFSSLSIEEYEATYGYLPYGYYLEGFVLNKDSVLSVTKIEDNKYELTLDGEVGGSHRKTQMIKYGSLNGTPTFISVKIIITINNDFTPVTVEVSCVYDVNYPVLGTTRCNEDYVASYYFNE
ncbi:MAG: hypothetical protein J5666_03400 [Bacilli bacterium]|nr:hypothetical protein [Bacilli bacterium]